MREKETGLTERILSLMKTFDEANHTMPLEESLLVLVRLLQKNSVPVTGLFVNTYVQEKGEIRFFARATAEKAELFDAKVKVPEGYARQLSYSRRPETLLSQKIEDDPVTEYVLRGVMPDVRSYVMQRLEFCGRHLGVICFYSARDNAFGPTEASFIANLGFPLSAWTARVLMQRLDRENEALRQKLTKTEASPVERYLSASPGLFRVAEKLERIAATDVTVLIEGESGTGKEVTARTLVEMSPRAPKPFVAVNCGAIPASLIESELFGYEKGAFTDAKARHAGYFEQADEGTLFLDEVGELPLFAQVKLLRAIQEREIVRVGGEAPIPVNVRIIAATNRKLGDMVSDGRFRDDLYYRLNVFPIQIPPLRERPSDIGILAQHFLKRFAAKYHLAEIPQIAPEALEEAVRYRWPGNVRELENSVERAVLEEGARIRHLVQRAAGRLPGEKANPEAAGGEPGSDRPPLAAYTWEDMQKAYFGELLRECYGRISGPKGVAARAGLHPNTLRSRLKKLGLI